MSSEQHSEEAKAPFIPQNGLDSILEKIGNQFSWLYLVIVVISLYEIVMRYIFNSPTTWVHETSLALAAFCMLFGGLFTFSRDKHIRVDIVVNLLPKQYHIWFQRFSHLVTMLYLSMIVYATWFVAKSAIFSPMGGIQLERTGSSWNPAFPAFLKGCMFVFLSLFLIQVTYRFISSFRKQG